MIELLNKSSTCSPTHLPTLPIIITIVEMLLAKNIILK